jgi:type I restriction enzyme, S subunit
VSAVDEWFGALPVGWQRLKLKYVTDFINGAAFKPSDWGHEGVPIIRIQNLNDGADFNYTTKIVRERNHVQQGDILFGWSGNRGTSFGPFRWTKPGLFYLNQHIFLVKDYGHDREWLYWALKAVTEEVEKRAHGIIGMVHITRPELDQTPVPVPPLPAQRTIADFLDRKTAAIDALIEKKERLLALLAEKRAALIHRAVTKGLDSDVPMKDSGVPWIGEIPAHWEVKRLKFLLDGIEQGWSPECEQRLAEGGEWAVLKVGCVNHGVWRPEEHKALPASLEPRQRFEILVGDVLMSRANTSELVGSVARVSGPTGARLLLCDKLYRLSLTPNVDPDFLVYLLNSWVTRKQHEVASSGASASMQNISQPRAGNLVLAVPPAGEQRRLAASVAERLGRLATTRKALNRQLDKLHEYRQALITAAVTGQLDIQGAA